MKISHQRWSFAQENEQGAWEDKKIFSHYLIEAHKQLWQDYLKFIQEHIQIKENDRILVVGHGD